MTLLVPTGTLWMVDSWRKTYRPAGTNGHLPVVNRGQIGASRATLIQLPLTRIATVEWTVCACTGEVKVTVTGIAVLMGNRQAGPLQPGIVMSVGNRAPSWAPMEIFSKYLIWITIIYHSRDRFGIDGTYISQTVCFDPKPRPAQSVRGMQFCRTF